MSRSEQEALQALRSKDFNAASVLLKNIVEGNGYSSPVLNNAYTVALYKCGNQPELAAAAFRIGNLLVEHHPAEAMNYFQRALLAGLSAEETRSIGVVFERWAAAIEDRSALPVRTDRVAHVVGCLMPGHAPSLYVQILAKALREMGIESHVFTTEWTASWFFNPRGVRQSQPIEIEAETTIASLEGDFVERAARVAQGIRDWGAGIALYHCSLAEQMTVRVAALKPARIQLNVNHANEADADIFTGFVHLFENGVERSRFRHRPWRWIPLISDIESRLAACRPATRQEVGLEAAETVSGTFGNLYKVSNTAYLTALAEILNRFPRHMHLFAGAGDDRAIKEFLREAGVLARVRFLGHIPDVAGLLGTLDVYLSSFPDSGGQSVLEPMAAGIAAVVRGYAESTHQNVGVEMAGLPEVISDSDAAYVAIADKLLRNSDLRRQCGDRLRERFQSQFRPAHLAAQYRDFFAELSATEL